MDHIYGLIFSYEEKQCRIPIAFLSSVQNVLHKLTLHVSNHWQRIIVN